MRLGISLQPAIVHGDPDAVFHAAVEVERLGFDAVSMTGQVVYDYVAHGSQLDPFVLLSAVAGVTERISLITSVVALPHYGPVVLANQASSLDVLSGGRFILGVGAGWNRDESAAVGIRYEERGRRADEYLEAIQALWSHRPASFEGRFAAFRDVTLGTPPRTRGGPPIWVGGHSDAALRRAMRYGQAWHGVSLPPDGVGEIRRRLSAFENEVGRDAATVEVNSVYFLTPPGFTHNGFEVGLPLGGGQPSVQRVVEDLGRRRDAGVSMCDLILPVASAEMRDAVEWVATEILPRLDIE